MGRNGTDLYLGVDIGTSVAKGVVIDGEGRFLHEASVVRAITQSEESSQEHDADQVWWNEFSQVLSHLLHKLGSLTDQIKSIAVTAMVPNILPIDGRGRPLRKAILYYDGRAKHIENKLDQELGTSKPQSQVLAQLIWLKKEFGPKWKEIDTILTTHSYIVYKLTGKKSIDTITALECGNVLDSNEMRWNVDLLERSGINPGVLPEILPPRTTVGVVTEDAAVQTGLRSGLPVAVGTTDMIGSFIGSGAQNPNEMMISYGTYGCAPILLNDLEQTITAKKVNYPMDWAASIPRSGQQLVGLSQALLSKRKPEDALSELDNLASTSTPGANNVTFLQILDLANSIESTEPRGSFLNLGVNNSMADICRAMLEAFGYGLKYRFETWTKPVSPRKCFAASGGARSKIWRQIVSDITGIEQYYFLYSSSAYGAAMLAAASIDSEAWDRIRGFQSSSLEVTVPNPHYAQEYGMAYNRYKKYVEKLADSSSVA